MKITILPPTPGQEDEIIIRCAQLDDSLMDLIRALKAEKTKLTAYSDAGITMLSPKEIYYFESVDDKVFAYCEKQVYQIRKKLYELEADFAGTDFLRISKSTIVDLSKVAHLSSAFNGRLEAKLRNGEKLIISRQYVGALRKKLGI
ncbi:MAG: LytTR family transcriptional regulator DNA-binding domain-containing protein [Oscillospiraceae bacterium]|nr:LytTR family transcriptional regulator DNA-binding domain-containing protein [Oscillospiraceae bacterium]